jgi:hypothetical protein
MKERRVRQVKIRIAERRQSPEAMLAEMRRLKRKPPIRVTPKRAKG